MPITDSRLKTGTLTFTIAAGTPVSFATQATNVQLVPSTSEVGDPLETLSGDTQLADDQTDWVLSITAVQDFTDPAGFINFALTNAGDLADYTWAPHGATGPSYAGSVKVRPVVIGGDVNQRLTTSAEWPCQETPTATYPAP